MNDRDFVVQTAYGHEHNTAEVCEKRARHQAIIAAVDGTSAAAQLDAMAAPLNLIEIDKP